MLLKMAVQLWIFCLEGSGSTMRLGMKMSVSACGRCDCGADACPVEGIAPAHSHLRPEQRVEYALASLWASGQRRLVGKALRM